MSKFIFLLVTQLIVFAAMGQNKLSGVVKTGNEPLAGASVILKNSMYGISTQSNGSFEFKNLKPGNYTVLVSFIGYTSKKVEVNLKTDLKIEVILESASLMTDEVMISASLAKNKTPMAFNNLGTDEIARQNMGRDIPYLMQLTPSFVTTSDAGTGIGYTSFRIRGTDMNRINVAINGIPLNDAESHGTWFVDQPDMASSLENVQIQRGAGTSANGAAAFGATINMQTSTLETKPYAEYNTAIGSFSTFKNTLKAGTGLMNGKFAIDTRLSKISSAGYIDRANASLKSFYVSAGYFAENTVLKAVVFSGLEDTYQAWNGVPSEMIETNRTYNSAGEYTDENGVVHYYENQVDHYLQNHYQLHYSHSFNRKLSLNASAHFTHGEGYYENYMEDEDLADYQIPPVNTGSGTIEISDLINRKWLSNDFYGFVYALHYQQSKTDFTLGGGYSIYNGNHWGNVIWAQYLGNALPNHEWYRSQGLKNDFNIFAKYNYQVSEKLNLFADMQFRDIRYSIDGIDNDLRDITQQHNFGFFNPKLGVFYQLQQNQKIYFSLAVANREPNRSNYVDADPEGKQPVQETLRDWEAGYQFQSPAFSFSAGGYFMDYKNQLVLTGEINDVGAPVMVNVEKSYRTGIELQAGVKILPTIKWNGNATFSKNKVKDFTEYVDNWDTWGQEISFLGTTDLSFSPDFTGNSQFVFTPLTNFDISLISVYVGKQFTDNTSNSDRMLDAWFVNNLRANYAFKTKLIEVITVHLQLNNFLNETYESNAWVYSYISEGNRYKMDGYFPQAGTNFMFGIDFKL